MKPITLDDVIGYLSETIEDREFVARIERERESNPQVASWFTQMDAAVHQAITDDDSEEDEWFPLQYVRDMFEPPVVPAPVDKRDSAWICHVVTGLAARTEKSAPPRQRAECRDGLVYLSCSPEDVPSQVVLIRVYDRSQPDVPLGPGQVLGLSRGESLKSGPYLSAEIAVSQLLPQGTVYDDKVHQIEISPVDDEMLTAFTTEQRARLESWYNGEGRAKSTRPEQRLAHRQLAAESIDESEDDIS